MTELRVESLQSSTDREVRQVFDDLGFLTGSDRMAGLLRQAAKAACVSDITVLLEGETGTGKQVLADAIHQLDRKRRSFPFVTVHCATINETLAESELFGHLRGSFSGAASDRKGLFQSAHGGTLFLDDVNDLPVDVQPKLLDVLQRRTVRAVGSDREAPFDVRVMAACNQPLEPLVREGRFRSDLYYRLNVAKLKLPALRQRADELPTLTLALAQRYRAIYGPIEAIDTGLLQFLQTQAFPGNVRELENTVQRMLFLKTRGTSLGLSDWMAQGHQEARPDADVLEKTAETLWMVISQQGMPYAEAMREIERRILESALKTGGGTRREIARRLSTSERTLYHKMRAHRLRHSLPV